MLFFGAICLLAIMCLIWGARLGHKWGYKLAIEDMLNNRVHIKDENGDAFR